MYVFGIYVTCTSGVGDIPISIPGVTSTSATGVAVSSGTAHPVAAAEAEETHAERRSPKT
jgi:hypothetical protein